VAALADGTISPTLRSGRGVTGPWLPFCLIRRKFSTIWDSDTWLRGVGGALFLILGAAGGAAGGPVADLRNLLPNQQVVAVKLCRGQYDVILKDGGRRQFGETNLAFKIETGELGAAPAPSSAVLVPSRRQADRAFVVFPSLEAL
jgi:hypothetical protein